MPFFNREDITIAPAFIIGLWGLSENGQPNKDYCIRKADSG